MPELGQWWYITITTALVLWVFQGLVIAFMNARRRTQRHFLELHNLLAEIEVERRYEVQSAELFRRGLEQGIFERQLAENPKFAPYFVAPESRTPVFGPDASERFSFISAETFSAVRVLKDAQSVLRQQLLDLRSPTFLSLERDRKLLFFENIAATQRHVTASSKNSSNRIKKEIAIYQRRFSWYLTFAWMKYSHPSEA